jgi:hypothetical protein
MTKQAQPKMQKPTVFDDKSTGLRCLTIIVVANLGTMAYLAYALPNSATTNALTLALTNIISTAVGGIVGIVTGTKWAVRQGNQNGQEAAFDPPVTEESPQPDPKKPQKIINVT